MLLLGFRGFRQANKRAFVSVSHLAMMAAIALATATVVGGSGYLIRELHRQAGLAKAIVTLPSSSIDLATSTLLPSDLFKVTSIALGKNPVAIINGVAVGEGGTIQVQT